MENILPRREARENAFLLAFSQTFGDVPLAEALTNHAENDEEHPVDGFSKLLRLDCKNNGIDLRKPRTGFLMSMDTVFGRKTLQFLFIVINDVNIIALPVT